MVLKKSKLSEKFFDLAGLMPMVESDGAFDGRTGDQILITE